MPLAHGGPKAFPFPSGSAKAISPVLPTGRVPFVFFPPAIMSMFHVELFSSVTPFSFGHAFGLLRAKGFFFSSGSTKAISPALLTGRVPFVSFPPAIMSMFHVELFLLCLWLAAGRRFFPPTLPKKPARPVRQGRRPCIRLHPKTHPNVPHGTFFTFQNGKKPGFVRFACFHPPVSVL